jgi:cyanophycinase
MRNAAAWLFVLAIFARTADAKETRYLTGNGADVESKLSGPALLFGGGSNDETEPFQRVIDQVRGCNDCSTKLDVVVLRCSGGDEWNEFIYGLNGVNSVETLVITNREDANSAAVEQTIRNAEIIFFAGGDQCNYVRYFKGTRVEKSVEHVYAKGGGIGGTSAGLAIQGSAVYDACVKESAYSQQALANPYYGDISFTHDFFNWKHMEATITDTHLSRRDRMGRFLVFIARQIADRKYEQVLGIGVDEGTSVVVDASGQARVVGDEAAFFVFADHKPEVCEPGVPLTYSNFKIWKRTNDGTFDLKKRSADGYYLVSVEEGKITSDPY